MPGGYIGKILRVDLSKGSITEEGLPPDDILRKYVGGLGLGLKMLTDELPLEVKPLEPENRLIFMTGPLTGTPVMSANNTTIVCLNGETGYTVGASHSHGYLGPYLKFAGYDGFILQGAARTPLYLWIRAGKVELKNASHLWGKDTHEAEDMLKEEVGDQGDTAVATIGPAGENMLCGSLISNERYHLFSKASVGAIMGSKKLKAIVIDSRGGKPFHVNDGPALLKTALEWRKSALSPVVWSSLGPKGTHMSRWRYNADHPPKDCFVRAGKYTTAVRNLSDPELSPGWRLKIRTGAVKFKVTPVACYNCNRACTYSAEVTEGPFKGYVATLTGGGETFEASAGLIGVDEPGAAFFLCDYMDRMGFDSSTPGSAISLAYECYERGLLTKENTDGLELKWGNYEAAKELLDKIVKREGFGAVLADGPKEAAERIGGDAPKYVIHVKGTSMNMHDWRGAWGTLLGQCIAGAGPCWQAPGVDAYAPEPDLGYPELSEDPISADGKAEAVWKTQCKKLWEDCIGICWFAAWSVPGSLDFERRAIAAATGWDDFTVDEELNVGKRIITLQRIFNMKRGMTVENDLDVGQRLLDPPDSGPGKGKAFGDYLPGMVKEYYSLAGWDPDSGEPLPETIEVLGLQEEAPDL
ncbi:aldehyde ferredoxin oxidoreductase family protein [Chloroflexota bacterium]